MHERLPIRLEELAQAPEALSVSQPAWTLLTDRWIGWAPLFEDRFRALPDPIDRTATRTFCEAQSRDADGLVSTFIASQVWGHRGGMGYGPYRVSKALESRDLVPALQCAADDLGNGDPVAAFEALCVVFDLPETGTSFATKYLYFADPDRRALILDERVAEWIETNTGLRWRLHRNVRAYELWLGLASRWADELCLEPDQVELLIFTDAVSPDSGWRP